MSMLKQRRSDPSRVERGEPTGRKDKKTSAADVQPSTACACPAGPRHAHSKCAVRQLHVPPRASGQAPDGKRDASSRGEGAKEPGRERCPAGVGALAGRALRAAAAALATGPLMDVARCTVDAADGKTMRWRRSMLTRGRRLDFVKSGGFKPSALPRRARCTRQPARAMRQAQARARVAAATQMVVGVRQTLLLPCRHRRARVRGCAPRDVQLQLRSPPARRGHKRMAATIMAL